MNNDKEYVINWVVDSLQHEPWKWQDITGKKLRLEHENGVSVWIGSQGASCVAIEYFNHRIGGLAMHSMLTDLFGFPVWRRKILKAAKPILFPIETEPVASDEAVIRNVIDSP